MVEENNADKPADGADSPAADKTAETGSSEEDIEAINLKPLLDIIEKVMTLEHLVISLLIIALLLAIWDRQHLINSCNSYWINEVEKITNPLFTIK